MTPDTNDSVALWLAPLAASYDTAQLAQFETLLDAGERARWQRFRFPEDRLRFLVGRAFLRKVLAATLGHADPAALRFVTTEHGKPELAGADAGKLQFNLSHTRAMLVLATSRRHALGVDVEALTRDVDLLPLAQRYFTQQEVDELRGMRGDAQRERFFMLWTLKEAWLKACGLGLRVPLDSFRFDLSGPQPMIVFGPQHDDSAGRYENSPERDEDSPERDEDSPGRHENSPEHWQFRVFARGEFRIALAVDCAAAQPVAVQLHAWHG